MKNRMKDEKIKTTFHIFIYVKTRLYPVYLIITPFFLSNY